MTQASVAPGKTRAQISEKTLRKDPWWRAPAITATLLTLIVLPVLYTYFEKKEPSQSLES